MHLGVALKPSCQLFSLPMPVDRQHPFMETDPAMKLHGKTALVTGAARGIGRGCALELARAGADVTINDRVRTSQLESLAAEIQSLGHRSLIVEGNIFHRPTAEQVVERAIAELGHVDILLSNPALQNRQHFLDYDPETFTRVIEGTLIGGFHMSQLIARHMVKRSCGGKIIFISSVHVLTPYCAASLTTPARAG